jgi:hypothetical protein
MSYDALRSSRFPSRLSTSLSEAVSALAGESMKPGGLIEAFNRAYEYAAKD